MHIVQRLIAEVRCLNMSVFDVFINVEARSGEVVPLGIDVDPSERSVWQQWYSWYQLHYFQLMVVLSAVLSTLCASMLCVLTRGRVAKQNTKYAAVKALSDTEADDIEIQPIIN